MNLTAILTVISDLRVKQAELETELDQYKKQNTELNTELIQVNARILRTVSFEDYMDAVNLIAPSKRGLHPIVNVE